MRKLMFVLFMSVPALAYADGKATFDAKCASCHGQDGKGKAEKATILKVEAAKLDLTAAKATRDEVKTLVLKGKNKMPGYEKKLTAEEVDPVVDYALTFTKK